MSGMNSFHDRSPALVLPPLTRTQWLIALALTLAWTLLLALLSRELLAIYYPFADEWALLANADPDVVSPLRWFTHGFSDYFSYQPELSQPFANFVRPGFNFTYWMLGLFLTPDSSWRLVFNFVMIGACSGLVWLSVAQSGSRWALPLAAAVPLMPGYITSAAHSVACLAYDPMVAALSLAAILAYQRGRLWLSVALLLYAVMTKETSLPVAAALPAIHFLQHWRELRSRPVRGVEIVWLALPVVAWVVLRLSAFKDVSGGTYAFQYAQPIDALRGMLRTAPIWPLWIDPRPWRLPGPLTPAAAGLWLVVLANLAVVASLGLRFVWQWLRGRPLDAALLAFLASDLFMLLVGNSPRYGAVTSALLIVCLVRWLGSGSLPRLAPLVTLLVVAGTGVTLSRQWGPSWELQKQYSEYSGIARQYVAALRWFPAGSRVIVLNDPTTWHSRANWLREAAHVPAEVYKVTDYTCPGADYRIFEPCAVSLKPTGDPLRFEFTQSCGFDLCNAVKSGAIAIDVKLVDSGVRLAARPESAADTQAELRPLVWRHATVTLDRGDAWLLYFDPDKRTFHRRYVPALESSK